MPTKETQAVIDAAKPLAARWLLMQKHARECQPQVILDGSGYLDIHMPEGIDVTNELNNLTEAVLDLLR